METKNKIRGFLTQYIRNPDLQNDENIFEAGYVNSLFAMQLVLFIENDFGLELPTEELSLENFQSVDAMSDLIARHLAYNGQPA